MCTAEMAASKLAEGELNMRQMPRLEHRMLRCCLWQPRDTFTCP